MGGQTGNGDSVDVVTMTMKETTFETFCKAPASPVPGRPDRITVTVPEATVLELNTAIQGGIRGQIYPDKKKGKTSPK